MGTANGRRRTAERAVAAGPVLVADGDPDWRDLTLDLLERAGLPAVGVANGAEVLEAALRERPVLVILETCLEGLNGYEVLRELRAEFGPELPVLFVSARRVEPMDRTAGLMLGADDYVVKPFDPGELLARVRRLAEGPRHGSGNGAERHHGLTPRELEVLQLLAEGKAPKEIAQDLHLSVKTVSNHIQRIFQKLGVHTQAQAVSQVFKEHILS